MLAVLENSRTGEVITCAVPEPELRRGMVLVRTAFSAISSGTERAKLELGSKSLVGKAISRPELVKQVMDVARSEGVTTAYNKVKARLETLSGVGYSCAGTVLDVGAGVNDLRVGERVACAGAGYANHCEINIVPRNLVVHVPDEVPLDAASLTTIGAIALQGLRQGNIAFGETVAVVGAGLVGILAIQLARAAGCRVIAIDRNPDRVAFAKEVGAAVAINSDEPTALDLARSVCPQGVDVAVITAATKSADPLEFAAAIARDRARLVVVGDVGLGVSRKNMYGKELTLSMSRSYGPGRYDPAYEEDGIDYPIGYVRWTERRNMEAFLQTLQSGAVDVSRLLNNRFPVGCANQAYAAVMSGGAYTCILEYPSAKPAPDTATQTNTPRVTSKLRNDEQIRIGCVGAGGFARGTIIPILQRSKGVVLDSVATGSGITAESARRSFGFANARTPSDIFRDPQLGAIFVMSRHESHGNYVAEALAYGKMVFVEKPLAVTREELARIAEVIDTQSQTGRTPFLMVGFNRRFAPFTREVHKFFANHSEPMMINIRVNAGYLPRDHWTQREGGRIIGEGCHFIDWARYTVAHSLRTITASVLPDGARYSSDNVSIILTFQDGSVANIVYLANGDKSVSKEYFEVFCEGAIARLDDFSSLELSRNGKTRRMTGTRNKGHKEELEATLEAMRHRSPSPIPLNELFEVSDAAITVTEAMRNTQTVVLNHPTSAHSAA